MKKILSYVGLIAMVTLVWFFTDHLWNSKLEKLEVSYEAEISDLENEIADLRSLNDELSNDLVEKDSKINELKTDIDSKDRKIKRYEDVQAIDEKLNKEFRELTTYVENNISDEAKQECETLVMEYYGIEN